VKATQVYVLDKSAQRAGYLDVVKTYDARGERVSLADFTGGGGGIRPLYASENHEWYVSFSHESGGGVMDSDGTEVRGLGHLLQWLLQRAKIPVDTGRCEVSRAYLDQFKIDTWINTPTRPPDWIRANILPYFPVAMCESEVGWYFHPLRWEATHRDVVMELTTQAGRKNRITPVEALTGTGWTRIANEFFLDYAPRADGTWARHRSLRATDELAGDSSLGNFLCQASQTQPWGVRTWRKQCRVIAEDATADLLLAAKARELAFPRLRTAYVGDPELAELEAGAVVSITDVDRGWSNRLALVEGIVHRARDVVLRVITLDDPVQTTRYTGR
jgi:hypothetical protein